MAPIRVVRLLQEVRCRSLVVSTRVKLEWNKVMLSYVRYVLHWGTRAFRCMHPLVQHTKRRRESPIGSVSTLFSVASPPDTIILYVLHKLAAILCAATGRHYKHARNTLCVVYPSSALDGKRGPSICTSKSSCLPLLTSSFDCAARIVLVGTNQYL